jgi:hypothetical protein
VVRRAIGAAPLLAALLLLLTPAAEAAPTELTVRIEGATRTLFEGPILSDGHDVRAASDGQARPCDGTNGGANPGPGPTPTAAAVDAMGLVGQDFDGSWYPGFDDYFIQRWGPDREDPEAGAYWGLLVNGTLAPFGGCQWRDAAGDEVLWAYDAFNGRRLLRLAAADDPSPAPEPPASTAAVEVGQPLELSVQAYSGAEGEKPKVDPAAGVTVAPVATEPGSGYETVETGSPDAVITAADGTASVSFDAVGWWRLKAEEDAHYVRSNRLDVCVEPVGGGSCGPPPTDAQLRVPARYLVSDPKPQPTPLVSGAADGSPAPGLHLGRVKLDPRSGAATLVALVSGQGRLRLGGGGVRRFAASADGAGRVVLRVRPTAKTLAALRRSGRFPVSLRVAFVASGKTLVKRCEATLRLRVPSP